MPVFTKGGSIKHCAVAVLALAGIALVHPLPGAAQTRTIASLGDVPTLVPAPYHPQTSTAHVSSALYDSHPYYGGVYFGIGPHYWH
jgi:hypothetical protein